MRRWAGALMLVVVAACSRGEGSSGPGAGARPACGAEVEEPLDPRSTQHLLPGAPEPAYPGPAPTSGPHVGGPAPAGVQPDPLPRPVQVAVLEQGRVLIQHRQATPDERRRLDALAGSHVVVAPNPSLSAPLVVTAWRHRLECDRLDAGALEGFIMRHATGRPVG